MKQHSSLSVPGECQAVNVQSLRVLFAGGGSGGHISPGLAIAERLAEIAPRSRSFFACSDRDVDTAMLNEAGAEFVATPATAAVRQPLQAPRFFVNFHRSARMIMRLIRDRGVNHVVTMGGFVAGPAATAAKACHAPLTLLNFDAPPGRANRWLAARANRVLSAIEVPEMPGFASQIVGMPIRRRAVASNDPATCRVRLRMDPAAPMLLVTGASQGAASVNAFLAKLTTDMPELFSGWQVLHLSGSVDAEALRAYYGLAGISARVEPFLHEMGLAWGAADLAISRAGASSVAEAAHNAVPTLFLPYPHHKDMHQRRNAQPLADLPGGGAVVEVDRVDPAQNVQAIGPVLRELMHDRGRLDAMRANLRKHRPSDAALTIARLLVEAHQAGPA
jgi:UDP-N-acetylglucosamine--N-acetylmuramyl-(pentapeptide) pyrophosphoryl-undecaprenol N-acetylglucosamine transferase